MPKKTGKRVIVEFDENASAVLRSLACGQDVEAAILAQELVRAAIGFVAQFGRSEKLGKAVKGETK